MTINDIKNLFTILKSTYPHAYKDIDTKEKFDMVAQVWIELFSNIPFELAKAGLIQAIRTNKSGFPPTVSEILENCMDICKPKQELNPMESWGAVLITIRQYGSYRETEAIEQLDELTREAVKNIGYKNICLCEQDQLNTLRAQFRTHYEAFAKQKETFNIIREISVTTT